MLGVRREWRGRGIATRLKFFQRAWCLERGIRLMTWTYDPLFLKNARLNLVQLRARGSRYLANLYGPLGGLYGTLPSDRFEVLWRLDAPEVVRAARGIVPEVSGARELPRATPRRLPRTRRVAVEVPPGAPEFYATDAAAARRARFRLRRVATRLFALGFEATAIDISHQPALYVFERS
jgi:predicted GNAT superfamily acetyltransferase